MNTFSKLFGNNNPNKEEKEKEEIAPFPVPTKRIKGKIFHLNSEGGYGFISSHDLKFTRIYFHWTALKKNTLNFSQLEIGMEVEFNLKWNPAEGKGWRAIKIEVIEGEKK